MTDSVADRFFQHDRILKVPLAPSSLQDDLVNAVAHPQHAPAELSHRGSKQKMLVLTGRIQRLFNLRQRLHSHQVARPKVKRLGAGTIGAVTDNKSPTVESADISDLVVDSD